MDEQLVRDEQPEGWAVDLLGWSDRLLTEYLAIPKDERPELSEFIDQHPDVNDADVNLT